MPCYTWRLFSSRAPSSADNPAGTDDGRRRAWIQHPTPRDARGPRDEPTVGTSETRRSPAGGPDPTHSFGCAGQSIQRPSVLVLDSASVSEVNRGPR